MPADPMRPQRKEHVMEERVQRGLALLYQLAQPRPINT